MINFSWFLVVSCKWDWRHCALKDEQDTLVGWDVHSSSTGEMKTFLEIGENRPKMGLSMGNNSPSSTFSSFEDKIAKQLW